MHKYFKDKYGKRKCKQALSVDWKICMKQEIIFSEEIKQRRFIGENHENLWRALDYFDSTVTG